MTADQSDPRTRLQDQPSRPAPAWLRGVRYTAGAAVISALALGMAACTQAPAKHAPSSSSSAVSSSTPSASSASASASSTSSASSTASSSATASESASAQTTSTVGALAAGFPSGTVPVFSGAQVKQSAFERGTQNSKASLVLVTDQPADAVVDFYSKTFTDAGFKQLPGDAVGTLKSRTFIRNDGNENANVSAVTDGKDTTVTVAVSVAPDALK